MIITALAFFTRFYKLDHPNEVVFDEVHFGKFASYVSKYNVDGTDGSICNGFIFSMYILPWLKFCSPSRDGLLVTMDTFCSIILATRTFPIKCRM